MSNRRIVQATLLTAIAVVSFTISASGQTLWTDQRSDRSLSIEFSKPEFEGEDNADFLTSATFLSGRFPIGRRTFAEVDLPIARYGIETDFVERSQSGIGNPYVGILSRGTVLTSRIGVRLPFASRDDGTALTAGRLTDFDRFEAFLADVVAVNASIAGPTRLTDNTTLHLGGGPLLLVSTEDRPDDNAEVYAHYFALAEVTGSVLTVKTGVTGRSILTEPDLDFGERSVHQFGLAGLFNMGAVRPGLHVRIPLDRDLTEDIDYVVGANLTVDLR